MTAKKVLKYIFLVVVLILVIIFLIIKFWPKEPIVEPELSERAQEYLADEPVQNNVPNTITTNCFEAHLPIYVRNPQLQEDDIRCVLRATIDDPHQYLTISVETSKNIASIEEHTGVSLRLRETDKYFEERFKDKKSLTKKMFSTNDELTFFSFENGKVLTVSLFDITRFDDDTYELMEQFVDSVVVK